MHDVCTIISTRAYLEKERFQKSDFSTTSKMSLKCNLCSVGFKSDDQLNQHTSGKKHKRLESLKEEREKSARRSVFVSNLKKDTFVKQIEAYFEPFGKIVKIVTDPKKVFNEFVSRPNPRDPLTRVTKNSFAIVEFENEESVDKVLGVEGHKLNGKPLKITRREIKEFVPKTGCASSEVEKKELIERLKQEALSVNTVLGKCESLNEQVEKLIEHLKLDDAEIQKRELVCSELSQIFKQFWPETEFRVSSFGSTKNGLACKGSDLDLTLLLNSYLPDNQHKQQVMPKIVAKQLNRSKLSAKNSSSNSNSTENDVELEEDVEEEVSEQHVDNSQDTSLKACVVKFFNNKEYNQLIKFDVEVQVKIVARIIQRFSNDIKSLKTITNARCPVVRFFNDSLNINCDLSMNNYLACENTRLIRLYMDLEPNLAKIIFVLRYWFKQKNLYGGTSKFNSYTIICLIVFYMQTRNIGYLPNVDYLASLTDRRFEIHGWNCAFETDIAKIKSNRPSNHYSSSEIDVNNFNDLLKGFFEFYSKFAFKCDFDTYRVVRTRSGEIVSVAGSSTQLSKLSKYINVQDPLDLSHNLSANVSKNTLERFQNEARGSNELLHYGREPKKSASKGWGLILLMTKKSLPLSGNQPVNRAKSITVAVDQEIKTKESAQQMADFALFLFKDVLLFEQLNQEQITSRKRKRAKLLNQICTQVDQMGIEGSRSPSKRLKMTSTSSPHDENNNESVSSEMEDDESFENETSMSLGSFTLSARRNTWIGRRGVKRDLKNECANELELEKMCSLKLAEKNDQCSKEIDFRVEFMVEEGKEKLNLRFHILDELPSLPELADFDTLVHFLHGFVNSSLDKVFGQWSSTH